MIKAIVAGFLIPVLLIPTGFIQSLVRIRQERQEKVIAEVSSKWAIGQKITYPFLLVPYTVTQKNEKGQFYSIKQNAFFMPGKSIINGKPFLKYERKAFIK